MSTATVHFFNRMAIIFDFDDTLAPSTNRVLLESVGLDAEQFERERVQPLAEAGWDVVLARAYCLIEESRSRGDGPITQEHMAEVGRNLDLFAGVSEMFEHLRTTATELAPNIEVEFYLLTSGFVDIPKASAIAGEFVAMWGGEFHFDHDGGVRFPKKVVTHPEKNRYILQLAKGLGTTGPNAPSDVYRDVPEEEWHVPLDQTIYIGDGASDMPAFSLMNDRGGVAIGLYKSGSIESWRGQQEMHAGRRLENLVPVDYSADSELMHSLTLAVESIAKRIALRRLGKGK